MRKHLVLFTGLPLIAFALSWRVDVVSYGIGYSPDPASSHPSMDVASGGDTTPATENGDQGATGDAVRAVGQIQILAGLLVTGDSDTRLENLPGLYRLSSITLWNLLDQPQIASLTEAKFLPCRFALTCSNALQHLRSSARAEDWHSSTALLNLFKSLIVITDEERLWSLRVMNVDEDVAANFSESPASRPTLSDVELQVVLQQSHTIVDTSQYPVLIGRSIETLLSMNIPQLIPDPTAWQGLSPMPRGRIVSRLQQLVGCGTTHSCGRGTYRLRGYCGRYAHLVTCQPGMAIYRAAQSVLSLHDHQIMTGILNTIRQRRADAPGP